MSAEMFELSTGIAISTIKAEVRVAMHEGLLTPEAAACSIVAANRLERELRDAALVAHTREDAEVAA